MSLVVADGHQSYEFKFKDVERKFLTSREGVNSLIGDDNDRYKFLNLVDDSPDEKL